MTETLNLVKELVKKPLDYIHISQWNYFKKARRGEGTGEERLKLIHKITKGKIPLIGWGHLKVKVTLKGQKKVGSRSFMEWERPV